MRPASGAAPDPVAAVSAAGRAEAVVLAADGDALRLLFAAGDAEARFFGVSDADGDAVADALGVTASRAPATEVAAVRLPSSSPGWKATISDTTSATAATATAETQAVRRGGRERRRWEGGATDVSFVQTRPRVGEFPPLSGRRTRNGCRTTGYSR